jgi:N-acetylglutamate synthase
VTEPPGELGGDRRLRSASAATWPAIDTERLGDWQLRSSRGFTGRANSVLVAGDPGMASATAAGRAVEFYRRHRRPALAQVVVGSPGERALRDLGWIEARPDEADCWVMTRGIDPVAADWRADDVHVTGLTDEWLAAKFPAGAPDGAAEVLGCGRSVFASVRAADGAVVGVGRGSVAGGHVGITALWVADSQRRKGIGTRLLEALIAWGRDEGADTAFLEVLADNLGARQAYRGSGFVDRYSYRYLTDPDAGAGTAG